MRKNIRCPVCGKMLCRANDDADMKHDPRGDIFLWCKGCRTEIPFRYVKLTSQK